MTTASLLFGASSIPAIIGLVQTAKQIGLPTRFAPLAAVAFGILAGLAQLADLPQTPGALTLQAIVDAIATGVTLGLAAAGLYSGAATASIALRTAPTSTSQPGTPRVPPPPTTTTQP